MGRLSALLLVLFLAAASAVALVSCGGGDTDLLPGTTAEEIETNLDEVELLADEGDCVGAEDAVAEVVADVEGLQGVDLKLKTALQEGAAKLSEVVGRCEEGTEAGSEPTPETDVEAEAVEDEKKPKKEKPEDKGPEEGPGEGEEGPELPPQSNGKGEEKGGSAPPAEPEVEETAPSGGVGPGVGVE